MSFVISSLPLSCQLLLLLTHNEEIYWLKFNKLREFSREIKACSLITKAFASKSSNFKCPSPVNYSQWRIFFSGCNFHRKLSNSLLPHNVSCAFYQPTYKGTLKKEKKASNFIIIHHVSYFHGHRVSKADKISWQQK